MASGSETSIRIITDINKLCRTCLSEKTEEDLQSLFENSLDALLLRLAAIKVCLLTMFIYYIMDCSNMYIL